MPRFIRWATLIGMLYAIARWHALGAILSGVGGLVIWVWAARRFPTKDCPVSRGQRTVRSVYFPWAKGPCRACGGTGDHIRWSSRIVAPATARRIRARAGRHSY